MRTFEYLIPMPYFEYKKPASIREALELLLEDGTIPIAGGTDLIIMMNEGKVEPKTVVDIGGLGLSYVKDEMGEIAIGSTTTFQQIAESSKLQRYTCLVEAARNIGTWQIRNLATLGGNIANASPAADSVPPLLVLDAKVIIIGKDGEREKPLREFFYGPRKTDLKRGEIIKEVRFKENDSVRCRWDRVGRRNQNTLSIVSVSVGGTLEKERIVNARIALGAASPYPMLATGAMKLLEGKKLSDDVITEAANEASKESKPISDVRGSAEYRKVAIRALVIRLLKSIRGE
ncbi:MAG: FAD binding domain-containing protein [bacterium]